MGYAGFVLSAASPPAGGATVNDIVAASGIATVVTLVLLVCGLGHRSGKVPVLGWLARRAERVTGQPGWAALPCAVAVVALLAADLGLYWDIGLHADTGRDAGLFGTPAHFFILAGLFGIVTAGFFAICLSDKREGPTFVTITRDWHAPLGGVLMIAAGGFSLVGFPLDDVWHRLFGQDITLWAPPHLMMTGGAVLTALLCVAVLQVEARRATRASGQPASRSIWIKGLRYFVLPGGMLVAMTTYQPEWDLGIPQFQLIFQPILMMVAAGVALVAARVWLGPGTAFGAVLFFVAVRGGLSLLVDTLGQTSAHFPLYVVEAALVEGIALVVSVRRPLVFGAWCGVLIGTVGLAAEWGWSHVWMPLPWPSEILPQVAVLGLATALAGSVIGAYVGASLSADTIPVTRSLRLAVAGAALTVAAVVGFALHTHPDPGVSASFTLRDVVSGPERTVIVTARMTPPDAADHATWLTTTSWQGGKLVVDRMREAGPGVYRSTRPVPVHGQYKTLIRLHAGSSLTGVLLYAPADPAIPAPEVPARRAFASPFVSDHKLLQREAKTKDPGVTTAAYGVVLFLTLLLLGLHAWGLRRIRTTSALLDRGSDEQAVGDRVAVARGLAEAGPRPY
ncbi:MAG: hypothetical protein QOJ63_224 [Solirubrobacteraceae bacterium]|jgi:hypothetical protein|nr:hypothetical protein [Solirubrobacteraceae bacterium]